MRAQADPNFARLRLAARARALAVSFGLFVLAVAVRALPWRQVLAPESVTPFGNDAYYHLRRIVYGVVQFPAVLSFDPYLNFPSGAVPIWSPGFDWSLAALARLLLGDLRGDGLVRLERWVVWVPPLLGGVGVLAAIGLARRSFGNAEAWLAGALLCVLPAHFWYTQIGHLDHHAAVAWLSTAVVCAATALHRARGERAGIRAAGLALGCGALIAASLWVWPGFLLHLLFIELGIGAALLAEPARGEARRWLASTAAMHAVAALAIVPFAWGNAWPQWSETSPLVLSRFQPGFLGLFAIGGGACAWLWGRDVFGATRSRRSLSLCAAAAVSIGAAWLAVPDLGEGAGEALRWLTRRDAFQVLVSESAPLLQVDGQLSFAVAWLRFGPLVALYPLALVALAASARRHPERWILFAWAAGLFAATLLQRRFFDTASVGYAIALAAAGCSAWRAVARTPRARLARAAVAVAAIAELLPFASVYSRFASNEWRALRGEPLRAGTAFGADRAGVEVADWLYRNTPPTRGWLAPAQRPEYGVLAPWHLGHVIAYRARRPTVIGNFGDDLGPETFAWARRYERASEAEIADEVAARGVRYVVVEGRARLSPQPLAPGSLADALFFRDGAELARHRLVFESQGARFTDAAAHALYKVFEFVAGAEVEGRSAPGSTIAVALDLRTPRGRAFTYEAHSVAGADGTYRVRLPYANHGGPPSVSAAPYYRLRCADQTGRLVLSEADVRDGRRVAGPPLCGGSGTAEPAGLTPGGAAADGEGRPPESE